MRKRKKKEKEVLVLPRVLRDAREDVITEWDGELTSPTGRLGMEILKASRVLGEGE